MDKKTLSQATKFLFAVQIIASIMVIIASIVALCNAELDKLSKISTLFDAVMTIRVGCIITFSVSLLACAVMYYLKAPLTKTFFGTVIGIFMFIMNFVLKPYSSSENFSKHFIDNFDDILSSMFSSSNNYSDVSLPIAVFILLMLVAAVSMSLYAYSFSDISEYEEQEKNSIASAKGGWECQNCQKINSASSSFCIKCFNSKPNIITSPVKSKTNTWKCKNCGTVNSEEKNIALIAKKNAIQRFALIVTKYWICMQLSVHAVNRHSAENRL